MNSFLPQTTSTEAFIRLSLVIPAMMMVISTSPAVIGQITIPLSQLHPEVITKPNGELNAVKVIGDRLFVGTDEGLWMVSRDGKATQVVDDGRAPEKFEDSENVPIASGIGITGINKGRIDKLEVVANRLFAITYQGLWIISEDGRQATKIKQVTGSFYGSGSSHYISVALARSLSIRTNEGSWLVSFNGQQVYKVRGDVHIMPFGERLLLDSPKEGFLIFSNEGTRIGRLEKLKRRPNFVESIGTQVFFGGQEDLWVLNHGSLVPEKVINLRGGIYDLTAVKDQLYVRTDEGLWIVDKDSSSVIEVQNIREAINAIESFREKLFVGTEHGLWVVNDNKSVFKVRGLQGGVESIARTGTQLLINTDVYRDLNTNVVTGNVWIISEDEDHANKVEGIKRPVEGAYAAGDHIYATVTVNTMAATFLYKAAYRVEPKLRISTKLIPSGWWSQLIGYVVPAGWVPSGKVQADACYSYSDGTCTDAYDRSIPKEFRFAKASGDSPPSNEEYSTAEQFNYEIGWGKNDVHYWVKDKWGNAFEHKASYRGIPSQYFFGGLLVILPAIFVLSCFALAPKVDFAHSAIMNPWLRKYFSLGSIPLLLSAFPSLRRHLLRRYSNSLSKDKGLAEWKEKFVYPGEDFFPEAFGKKLASERKLLLTGQSGIGKTSFFKNLTAIYVSRDKPLTPKRVFPVYIPLMNYGGNSLEDLVYDQLFSHGKITDKELAPMFLEQGGLLIFLDGVNEVQSVEYRQKLSEFVERYWTSNYICLSSQQIYPETENVPKVELKAFNPETVRGFISQRVENKIIAERIINKLTPADYHLYSVPRDLEFAVEILNRGMNYLPRSRTELYKIIFNSLFSMWKGKGALEAETILCKQAYRMIVRGGLAFDSVSNPQFKEITVDLFQQRFLVRREGDYIFRHELIRSYLASEYFYPSWKNLFEDIIGKRIDSNWLEMLKFSCENIEDAVEVKTLVYEILSRSVRKDLVRDLFEWLKDNQPGKCKAWEQEFYADYGKLDFK